MRLAVLQIFILKKGRGFSDFQTTYAKKGVFKTIGNKKIFELYDVKL